MFFSISKSSKTINSILSIKHNINGWVFKTDAGWSQLGNVFFKGYALGTNLARKVYAQDFAEIAGNYCIIDFSNNQIRIHTDDSRSFLLSLGDDCVTNLDMNNFEKIWVDSNLYHDGNSWQIIKNTTKNFVYDTSRSLINLKDTADLTCVHILDQVNKIVYDGPILVADSHGVDSTLIRSALDYLNIRYSLVNKNIDKSNRVLGWGYKQLFTSDFDHLQITGFCGDEVLLRNPLYCHWMLQSYGVDIDTEYKKYPMAYMTGFYEQGYREKIQNDQTTFAYKGQWLEHVYNQVANDYQMWHFNRTITFTPFRNLNFLKSLMYADPDTILAQVIHGEISLECIRRLNKNNLGLINQYKNNKTPSAAI